VAAQPEGPGCAATTLNITSLFAPLAGPVRVTSPDENGQQVSTVLRIVLTGMRNVTKSAVEVRIGTTSLTGDFILFAGASDTPGFDQIDVRLPASLAGAGTVPVIVIITDKGRWYRVGPLSPLRHSPSSRETREKCLAERRPTLKGMG
jgi:hypothetical protein